MKKILIIGETNACRSQMAEGWMRYYAKNYAEITSAGIYKSSLDLAAAHSMSNAIIDISNYQSKQLDAVNNADYDFIIYLFSPSKHPAIQFNGSPKISIHPFDQPKEGVNSSETNINYDRLRDEIENFCFDFVHLNIRKLY